MRHCAIQHAFQCLVLRHPLTFPLQASAEGIVPNHDEIDPRLVAEPLPFPLVVPLQPADSPLAEPDVHIKQQSPAPSDEEDTHDGEPVIGLRELSYGIYPNAPSYAPFPTAGPSQYPAGPPMSGEHPDGLDPRRPMMVQQGYAWYQDIPPPPPLRPGAMMMTGPSHHQMIAPRPDDMSTSVSPETPPGSAFPGTSEEAKMLASRKYVCVMCNFAFSRSHDLGRHHKTHTGERLFECASCGKSFTRKDALKRHHQRKGCGGYDESMYPGTRRLAREQKKRMMEETTIGDGGMVDHTEEEMAQLRAQIFGEDGPDDHQPGGHGRHDDDFAVVETAGRRSVSPDPPYTDLGAGSSDIVTDPQLILHDD